MSDVILFNTPLPIYHIDNIFRAGSNNIQDDTKKRELLKNPTKIKEIQEKKFIHRN